MVPQIVPTELANPSAPENLLPRRSESSGDLEDMCSSSELFTPASQHAHRFVIERHMTSLSILGIRTFDRSVGAMWSVLTDPQANLPAWFPFAGLGIAGVGIGMSYFGAKLSSGDVQWLTRQIGDALHSR